MPRSNLLLSLIALATPLVAQTSYLYSPTWIANAEGRRSALHPGNYSAARYQFLDGALRGKPSTLRELALRVAYENHQWYSSQGRTWRNVALRLADGDAAKFAANMSANLLSSPTTVFSASVTWPTLYRRPATKPPVWGGTNGGLRFPFQSTHLHRGSKDLVIDMTFTGGRLANQASFWTADIPATYSLGSSAAVPPVLYLPTYEWLPAKRLLNISKGVTGSCTDGFFGPAAIGSYLWAHVEVHSPRSIDPRYRGKLVLSSFSFYTAPGAPVLHAWGLPPNSRGIDLGTGCNKLHMGTVVLHQMMRTPPYSSSHTQGFSGISPLRFFDWDEKTMRGLEIVAQAVWIDSRSRRVNLSQARKAKLPMTYFNQTLAPRACAFQVGRFATRVDRSALFNPCFRYGL